MSIVSQNDNKSHLFLLQIIHDLINQVTSLTCILDILEMNYKNLEENQMENINILSNLETLKHIIYKSSDFLVLCRNLANLKISSEIFPILEKNHIKYMVSNNKSPKHEKLLIILSGLLAMEIDKIVSVDILDNVLVLEYKHANYIPKHIKNDNYKNGIIEYINKTYLLSYFDANVEEKKLYVHLLDV